MLESDSSKDAFIAAVSEPQSDDETPSVAVLEAPTERALRPANGKRPRRIFLLLDLLLLVVLGGVAWLGFTARGLEACAIVLNSAKWEAVWNAPKLEAEQQAAVNLRKHGVLVIAEAPDRRVTTVNLEGATINDELLAQVAKLYRLTTLNASNCNVTDDQLRYFANLGQLVSLILVDTPVTDAGLAHLRSLSNLNSLQLGSTQISDRGLADIATLHNLKTLNLSKTQITDGGLKQLAPLSDLRWLMLADTQVTDAGLRDLEGLKNLHCLTIGKSAKLTRPKLNQLKKAMPALSVDRIEE